MKSLRYFIATLSLISVFSFSSKAGRFEAANGHFSLDGKPFVIKAAELHYPRIPKEYWENRILMSKALGMNTICLYVFWNVHEPKEGEFDFTGQNDLRRFVELCAMHDMKVILRPGPYVCAEWEMGGLPWWLLKDEEIRLRENDPEFLKRVECFEQEVARQLADLTIDNGGPIIMVQVENEYGAYGEDKEYVGNIRDILKKNFGGDVLMFQCDWSSNFTKNGLDDLLWTMNFGTGSNIEAEFAPLRQIRPESPLMCSEYWSGWFDKWGAPHETRPSDDMIAGIDEMLSKGISFSLYMTHGGTNWGHWAGANSPGYSPDVTSYDYDAPINEYGWPTAKYYALRDVLMKYSDEESLPEIPTTLPLMKIEPFDIDRVAPLFENLQAPVASHDVKSFEQLDMGFGSAVYSAVLPEVEEGTLLVVDEPHDFARVFVNGTQMGTLDRRNNEKSLTLSAYPEGARLDILVEATGRINFGRAIKDFKGITKEVRLESKDETHCVEDWNIHLLPDSLDFYKRGKFKNIGSASRDTDRRLPAGVYMGSFQLDSVADTFLNFETWGKGLVYVNGHGIGRFWHIGPQQTLYVPAPWLKEGSNEVVVFDVIGPSESRVEGLDHPIIDKVVLPSDKVSEAVNLEEFDIIADGEFNDVGDWQRFTLPTPETVQTLILMVNSTHDAPSASIAELYLLDGKGERISRENWQVTASSSDVASGNHTADKITDLQESTFWQSDASEGLPQFITIRLDQPSAISAIEYLSGTNYDAQGGIKEFSLLKK